MTVRFRVDPGDVPAEKAARRLGLTLEQFECLLPRLLSRGFPAADRDTGLYDLEAIDAWRRRRNPHLFPSESPALTIPAPQRDVTGVAAHRIAEARKGWDG